MRVADMARVRARAERLEAARPKVSEAQAVLDFFKENVLAPTTGPREPDRECVAARGARTGRVGHRVRLLAEPAVEASIRATLGESYLGLGEPAKAIRQLDQCLDAAPQGPRRRAPDTLRSMNRLADAHMAGGHVDRARPLYHEALSRGKAVMGADDPEVLAFMNNLGRAYLASEPALAEPVLREALAAWMKKARDDWHTYEAASLMGGFLLIRKNYAGAEPLPAPGL